MKNFLTASLLTCALAGTTESATIWLEDFSSYVDVGITGQGAVNGYPTVVSNWSIDVSACATLTPGSGSVGDYFMAVDTSGGRMEAVNVDGEAVWSSSIIDISNYTNVAISVDTSETGSSANANKYVKLFYRVNGEAETAFSINPESIGNWGSATATQSNLYGSTVQVIARVNNPNTGDKSIFDNVTVTGNSIISENISPILDSIGNKSLTVSNALNFTVTATDADNNLITLSATNLPAGAVFSPVSGTGTVTGQFNWASAEPVGVYTSSFYVTDGSTNVSETITITVTNAPAVPLNQAPVLAPIGNRSLTVSNSLSVTVSATDADNDSITLSASNLPPGAVFSTTNAAGSVSNTFEWAIAAPVGVYTTTFYAVDGSTNDFETITITVTNAPVIPVNTAPVLDAIGNKSLTVSNALNFTVTATDADDDSITLSATGLPAGAVFNPVSGIGAVTGQFSWASAEPVGVYTSSFYVTDGSTNASETMTITVTNAPTPEVLTGAVWNVYYNLPYQSNSGDNYPGQFVIRNALVNRINALESGDSAVFSTFTFSANYGAGTVINAMDSALDRGAAISFIADSDAEISVAYGGTNSLLSLSTRSVNPLNLVVDDSSGGIMHDKLGLFDYGGSNQWAFIASWNFTLGASATQWNIALEARSPSLYSVYKAETDELLAGHFHDDPAKSHAHDGSTFELDGSWGTNFVRFAPYPDDTTGGNNAERDIINLIAQAQGEIVFALNKLNREPIRDALVAAADRGVAIKGVMPRSDTDEGNVSAAVYSYLTNSANYATTNIVQFYTAYAEADYSVLDDGTYSDLIHAKYMVIDPGSSNAIVIHGSANWTYEALVSDNDNDENVVVLRHNEIAAEFYDHFQRITGTESYSEGNSTLVSWNFNDGDQVADSGTAANSFQTVVRVPEPSSYTYTGNSLSCSGWNGGSGTKYWETSFATTDHTDIKVSSVQTASSTGPADFKLQYKVSAGGTYTDVPYSSVHVPDGGNGVLTRILLPNTCNNQSTVFLRWIMTSDIAANGDTVGSSGAGRIDDIVIVGTAHSQPPVLESIGSQSVFENQTLSFTVTASDPVDNDPVTLSATDLPTGAVFTNGVFTWSNAGPVGSYPVTFYATDKDGSVSNTVSITVLQKPLLLISEIADPAGTGGGDFRFVELYNAGANAIDLAADGWVLSRQNSGDTWYDIELTGTVAAAQTYIVAKDNDVFIAGYGFAPNQSDGSVDGNGDDAYFLYRGGGHSSGLLIDSYGEADTDGTGTAWEYEDSRAVRKGSVTEPNPVWTAAEWAIIEDATADSMTPGIRQSLPQFSGLHDWTAVLGGSLSFTVSASDPVDNDTVTLTAANLPTGAVFTNDVFTWENAVPIGTYTVTFSAADPDGTIEESIDITVIEPPLLIISEVADPDSSVSEEGDETEDGALFRFVELYNTGSNAINLAEGNWYLSRQANGGDTWYDLELTGTVSALSTWIVSVSADDFETKFGFAPNQEDSVVNGNGDDAYMLYYGGDHSSGTLMDIYGELDTDGTDTAWEYENGEAERSATVDRPISVWKESEWNIRSGVTAANTTPGIHGSRPEFIDLTDQFVFSGDSLNFTVTAQDPIDTDDLITITYSNLPSGAAFTGGSGIGTASGDFSWTRPPNGSYSVTFTATDKNGPVSETISITVSNRTQLNERFYHWKGTDGIYELRNGQYWQQTSSETYGSYSLYQPYVTITNWHNTGHLMTVEGVTGEVRVEKLEGVIEGRIDGTFKGYASGRMIQLYDGSFWRQTSTETSTSSASRPSVLLWNANGSYRMKVDNETDIVSVESMDITSSAVTNYFTGLHRGNIYQLADGTAWKQTSSQTISSSETDVTAWRWTEDGSTFIRFVDRSNVEIGTCTATASGAPVNPPIVSSIDGWFRGWKEDRVYALKNGQFWQQTSSDYTVEAVYSPQVVISNWVQRGVWVVTAEGSSAAPFEVEIQQLTNVTRTAIDGWFYGFGEDEIFKMKTGDWWRQTSYDRSASTRRNPEIFIWNDSGTDLAEMPDEGRTINVEKLNTLHESTVTNLFTGLDYGRIYRLADGSSWLQISLDTVPSTAADPEVMLWQEGNHIEMLIRDDLDKTIGTCIIADPDEDSDSDGFSNAQEITAGTDLMDAGSLFQIAEQARTEDGHYILTWPSAEDRFYTIEWTPTLTNIFQTLETGIAGPQNSWTDTVHSIEQSGFYRVRVEQTNP
ncbi:MAG: putative Ig domain-containing protein [Kiritimatiellales bacterium]